MKTIFIFLSILFITACGPACAGNNFCQPTKQSLVNDVRNKAILQLKTDRGLCPCGFGSQMMDQVEMLALAFDYYKEINILDARELLIHAARVFLNFINSNEKIRPFLGNYPFGSENVEIRIFIRRPSGLKVSPEELCVITMVDGILEYETYHPQTHRLWTIYKETYEEAVAELSSLGVSEN